MYVRPGRRTGRRNRPARPADMVLSYSNWPDMSPDWACLAGLVRRLASAICRSVRPLRPACPAYVRNKLFSLPDCPAIMPGLSGWRFTDERVSVNKQTYCQRNSHMKIQEVSQAFHYNTVANGMQHIKSYTWNLTHIVLHIESNTHSLTHGIQHT
jgi:hypothetical protein